MRRLHSVIAAMVIFAATASAHHSAAAFDASSQITLQGRVTRLDWTSPHTYVYVTVEGAPGKPVEWMLETDAVPIISRSGWRRESLAVGSVVTVRASPDRNAQRHHALIVSIALGNGVVLTPRAPATASAARAASVAGVWNGLRGFTQRRIGALKPTPKGLAAMKAYTEASNPVTKCVPHVSPFLQTLPYLNEIEVRNDRVVIRSEFFNVDRTVYMDGRPHPKEGARTTQGHSTGRWEGEVLVVDTTLFADHMLGIYAGSGPELREMPSGPRKHVVERYQLSEDRTRLVVSSVVEDPDYLAEPFTMSNEWDYAPQQRLVRFGCNREQAQRYLPR